MCLIAFQTGNLLIRSLEKTSKISDGNHLKTFQIFIFCVSNSLHISAFETQRTAGFQHTLIRAYQCTVREKHCDLNKHVLRKGRVR